MEGSSTANNGCRDHCVVVGMVRLVIMLRVVVGDKGFRYGLLPMLVELVLDFFTHCLADF